MKPFTVITEDGSISPLFNNGDRVFCQLTTAIHAVGGVVYTGDGFEYWLQPPTNNAVPECELVKE